MKTKTLQNFKCIDKGLARIYTIMQRGKINAEEMLNYKLDKEETYHRIVGEFFYNNELYVGEMIISESDLISLEVV